MNLHQRSYQKELLDADNIPFEDIKQNMQELNTINTLLGGHKITIKGFKTLLQGKKQIHVCEIGCGGGDNLLAIKSWCERKHIAVRFTGVDLKKECIDFAKTVPHLQHCTQWITSDYRDVHFTEKPDIIFSSLFCHHFTNQQLIPQLQWLKQHATIGFFINDLQRHALAYHSIKIITKLFSKSYMVKHDAPLSVARGFTRNDWLLLFAAANITSYQIQWRWAFRYLITYSHATK